MTNPTSPASTGSPKPAGASMADTRMADSSLSDPAFSETAYRAARRRVRMVHGWYIHALVYACVIGGLWLIYGFSGHVPRFRWPLAPTLGWGLGLAIHGIVVWLNTSRKARQWESRKIEQYLHEDLAATPGRRK
jgi:hypothetical protein